MLARLPTAARHSKDIDLYRTRGDLTEAHQALAAAAALDLGDHFRFALMGSGNPGLALSLTISSPRRQHQHQTDLGQG